MTDDKPQPLTQAAPTQQKQRNPGHGDGSDGNRRLRVNVLQHTSDEGPGAIRDWIHDRGHGMWVYHPDQFGVLPTAEQTDMLVVLGGPMGPGDPLDWLPRERALLREVIEAGKPVFGVCLGAQQIARVLGAQVHAAPHKEVGWAPVTRVSDAIAGLPERMDVLHWHQDMFEIPDGAVRLFSSRLVENQGFLWGSRVLGLQFHFEPLEDNLREIVANDGDYAREGNDLHETPEQILAHGVPERNKAVLYHLLDSITR